MKKLVSIALGAGLFFTSCANNERVPTTAESSPTVKGLFFSPEFDVSAREALNGAYLLYLARFGCDQNRILLDKKPLPVNFSQGHTSVVANSELGHTSFNDHLEIDDKVMASTFLHELGHACVAEHRLIDTNLLKIAAPDGSLITKIVGLSVQTELSAQSNSFFVGADEGLTELASSVFKAKTPSDDPHYIGWTDLVGRMLKRGALSLDEAIAYQRKSDFFGFADRIIPGNHLTLPEKVSCILSAMQSVRTDYAPVDVIFEGFDRICYSK
jgi:hypothetical protein